MLITIEQAKAHLRVDIDDEDDLILLWIGAAERLAQEFLNRNVYSSQDELDAAIEDESAGEYPMVVNDLIRSAILLTVGHLYANREDIVAGVALAKLPIGTEYLLMPYRKCMGV